MIRLAEGGPEGSSCRSGSRAWAAGPSRKRGKSRLARRTAEELGLPRLDLALGGTSDSKVLGGTSRGWGSGKPNDLASIVYAMGFAISPAQGAEVCN